ncbi:reverse transcriptase domain-containing protein [Tanacetum coccineum]
MEVHVPHDVILNHILPRVPTKSVCQTSFEFTTINSEAPPSDHKGLSSTRHPLPPFEGITTDDYKLLFVNFVDEDVYIHSLKSDSWRKVDVFQHIGLLHSGGWSGCTYLNENLYLNQRLSSIKRFDTETERLSKIETPNVDNAYNYFATIMVKSDCIHVCVKYDIDISYDTRIGSTTCIKLWKLDEYGKMIEVVNYQLRTHVYDIPISYLIPFHLMKNGSWLMRSYENHQIYKVDLKNKMHIKDKGEGKAKGSIYDDFEYAKVRVDHNTIVDEEVIRYIETKAVKLASKLVGSYDPTSLPAKNV